MKKVEDMIVVSQEEIAKNIFKLVLTGEITTQMSAGQFVHVKVSDSSSPLLRRPISVCDINKEDKTFTMIYRVEGLGTRVLSSKKKGEVVNVLGPLGNGFSEDETNTGETALLVGGGIGVPPLYELSKRLIKKGVKVIHVLGFQTKDAVFYEEEFASFGETYVTTVDGTYGTKGFVTDAIANLHEDFHVYYSCGPKVMLRALEENLEDKKGFLSLEERMGCGIGACFACVCNVKGSKEEYKKVCSDGPVFKAGEVEL